MSFYNFIKSKVFWRNTFAAFILTIVIIWLVSWMLKTYTRHGSHIVVPDFYGVSLEKLEDFASDHDLEYVINDSLYDNSRPKGTVAMQDPAPGTMVKKNRKIYLTVVALKAEQVSMPNLVDLTLRQATSMLETYGLKAGNMTYVPDIAHNAILQQKFHGAEIKPGTLIEKGSKIDLVIGKGEESNATSVPDLYGLKQSEANQILQDLSLNIGNEIFLDGNDTAHARIYKQSPSANGFILLGGMVDLWYRSDKKYDFNNSKE